MKRTIWSNVNLDVEDWREAYDEYCEINDIDEADKSEDDLYNFMNETNGFYLDDERMILNKKTDGRILVIADLGLWNGRKSGYRILNERNVNAIFDVSCGDYVDFYFDGHNIKCDDTHHDGTNYYEFREIREDKNIDRLTDALYDGTATREMINRYTRSLGKYCKEIYGW